MCRDVELVHPALDIPQCPILPLRLRLSVLQTRLVSRRLLVTR